MYLGETNKELVIGNIYIVQPDNSKKMKHRNRICTLIEVEDHLIPSWGIVKFHDTKRNGKIDGLSDLKPFEKRDN